MSAALPEVGQYVWHPVYVRLEELGDCEVSWDYLLEGQDEWRERYGKQPGRADPDLRREFNE